jgi:hypothetical protein
MKKIIAISIAFLYGSALWSQSFDDMQKMLPHKGFYDFYYDAGSDKIYMVVENPGTEFLYVHSLSSGVGHNDLGLDRGQLGGQAVVRFEKAGKTMLLVQPNLMYRADSENQMERVAVEQAFARSVLYGFDIVDQKGDQYIIDLTDLLFSDAHKVKERLAETGQGSYELDKKRSAVELSRTRAFPDNVEFEAILTFSGKSESRLIGSVTPDPDHVTVGQHHSFVRLPDEHYRPRQFHPQSGCFSMSYMDYATPVHSPLQKRVIVRHRLQKKNPEAAVSEPIKPIVYYLDRGTPEPIRSALLEGGRWWNEAFEEIGFKDAFRVEMLPENADPLDVRYNLIQWVHRSTRGWSYGATVTDPRTGEIIKGHVSLGSLRIRQDFMIAQSLVNRPYATDDENHQVMMEFALARIRQLSAHEIGHTLGFTHNYAASSNGRASVMDYPHPLVYIEDGEIRLDKAYDVGIAPWDKVTVAYAYSEFEEREQEQLQNILTEASRQGLRFIADRDARAVGGAHPYAHLWDNGASAVEELENILAVRALAIKNYSVDNIPAGQPYTALEDIFVPLYFFHRYQVEAASKLIGGLEYHYSMKGDPMHEVQSLDADIQRDALDKMLYALSPDVLMIPEDKLDLFPPRAYGYNTTRESFNGQTGVTFDYLAPPATAANFTLFYLLHPERANRLIQQKAMDQKQLGLEELITSLLKVTLHRISNKTGYAAEVGHTINFVVLDHLISLAENEHSKPQVKAIAKKQLNELLGWLEKNELKGLSETYRLAYMDQIKQNKVKHLKSIPAIPPGAPIGMDVQTKEAF